MIEIIEPCAIEAGKIIMEHYKLDPNINYKTDKSPVTIADQSSNDFIESFLNSNFPDIPVITEETQQKDFQDRRHWKRCFLVDPLDGTKEFINKNGEFTVNIALIEEGEPIFGLIYAPELNLMYYGEKGKGSFLKRSGAWEKIAASQNYTSLDKVKVVCSRSHQSIEVKTFIKRLMREGKQVELVEMGSSLKLCMIADGSADVYPRYGNTMEWDIAAGHAIIKFSGKEVYNIKSKAPLLYNKESLLNPHFIAE